MSSTYKFSIYSISQHSLVLYACAHFHSTDPPPTNVHMSAQEGSHAQSFLPIYNSLSRYYPSLVLPDSLLYSNSKHQNFPLFNPIISHHWSPWFTLLLSIHHIATEKNALAHSNKNPPSQSLPQLPAPIQLLIASLPSYPTSHTTTTLTLLTSFFVVPTTCSVAQNPLCQFLYTRAAACECQRPASRPPSLLWRVAFLKRKEPHAAHPYLPSNNASQLRIHFSLEVRELLSGHQLHHPVHALKPYKIYIQIQIIQIFISNVFFALAHRTTYSSHSPKQSQ